MGGMIQTAIDHLPGSGLSANVAVGYSAIAVRVGDKAAIAHPRWMTRAQVAELAGSALRLLESWPDADAPT